MEKIKLRLQQFSKDRNWDQFHSPKNLAMALSGEVGELIELFQWLKDEETLISNISSKNHERAKEELADVFLYVIRLADKLDIDLIAEANKKIDLNSAKYPIELSKDNATKYNRRNE